MARFKSDFYVGSRKMQITDDQYNISFPVLVQYPTKVPSTPVSFGPYIMDVSPDSVISDGSFPLIIISHGNGGSQLIYRTISTYLVRAGYVVAMLEHYGNNRNNNELGDSVENLELRPRHVSLTIDHLLSDESFSQYINSEKIGVIGHSFGGYTALALTGGIPWTREGQQVKVNKDPRIKTIVLMAPAAGYFLPDHSLSEVSIPIYLLIAEHDRYTPLKWTKELIIKGISDPSQVTINMIKNAGHFSFISPFPKTMNNPNFLPSSDPPGFDREQFHKQLPVDILIFLGKHLS